MAARQNILAPESEQEAATMIADARAEGLRLKIEGNGSKRGIGNSVLADRKMTSSKLSGITAYAAEELVMVAKAGTTMNEINKVLAKNKHMHVCEPPDFSKLLGTKAKQTIGGIAATNMSGPRRFVSGAARDSLLGVRFINGQGQAIKNGGQVMKNVTGLDLVKLMGGSWGTLGFLTEVSFKVLPQPETEITLALHDLTDAAAAQLLAKVMATSAEVSGAAHAPADVAAHLFEKPVRGGVTFVRLEGLKETIAVRRDRVLASLGQLSKVDELDPKTSKKLWTKIRDVMPFADGSQSPVWRLSVAPTSGHNAVEEILSKVDGQAFYDWQGGLVWLKLDGSSDAQASTVRNAVANQGGGHATLIRASDSVRAVTPCFHPEVPAVAALSARIKSAMDPDGIFNAGKMTFDACKSAA